MERVALKTIDDLTANGSDSLTFVLPVGTAAFSFHVIANPADPTTWSGDLPSLDVQYYAVDGFYSLSPPVGGTIAVGKDNVFTRADAVSQVKLVFSNGATPPDAGLSVELFVQRRLG